METYCEAGTVKVYSQYLPSPQEGYRSLNVTQQAIAASRDDALFVEEVTLKRFPEGVNFIIR